MRLKSAGTFASREAAQDMYVDKYLIPKGVREIIFCHYVLTLL